MKMNLDMDEMLQSYGLDTPFPKQWKDSGISSALATLGEETTPSGDNSSALVDGLLGALTTSNTVASDEQDPLGSGYSVMELMRRTSGTVPKSATERGVYIPSSTTFDPRMFLRRVHGTSSLAELQQGLAYLKKSMAGNEHGLKQMVDSDYGSYVSSKRKLDDVVEQLNRIGVNESSNFGMRQLDACLTEAINQLTVRARPLDGVSAEKQRLENALRSLEANKNILELPEKLEKHLRANEHEQFLREYKHGVRSLKGMMNDSTSYEQQKLGSMIMQHAQRILYEYREKLHSQLMKTTASGAYAPLLTKLTALGVPGNPALEWLEHNVKHFSDEIEEVFNLLITTATRNLVDSLESGKKLDMAPYLRNLTANTESLDEIFEKLDTPDFAVDSEGATQQWKQLVGSFENLHHILNRAGAFYQEFVSSYQRSNMPVDLTQEEVATVTRQFQELLSMTGRKLVESLTAPVPKSMALPIAAAYSRDPDAAPVDASDHLTFLPLNSNSLAVAKYLTRILDILCVSVTKLSEIVPVPAHSSNPFIEGTFTVREQFVKTLCECWTRDAMQLGKTQEWIGSAASKFPHYFECYHGIIIEKLRGLVEANVGRPPGVQITSHIERVFPAAISLSIRSIESELVSSSRNSVHGSQALNEAQLQPASLGQDAKLLVTLNNLETLKSISLETIYEQFAIAFRLKNTQMVRREIGPEVDQISAQLFDIYIRKKRSRLSQVVYQETQRLLPLWREEDDAADPKRRSSGSSRQVRRVSNYIYECLMILVETHSLCLESCPQMTRRAIYELYSNLLSNILSVLRGVDSLSRYGSLQNIADLEFMRWALSPFTETTDTCQQIFDAIKKASTDNEIWVLPDGPRGVVFGVLNDAIKQSAFAFACFRSLEGPKKL